MQRAFGLTATVTLALSPRDTRPGCFVIRTVADADETRRLQRTVAKMTVRLRDIGASFSA